MSNKMWETAVDHAKTCVLGGKLYVYYTDDSRNVGVVFNNIYALCGLIAGGQYCPAETLTDTQKVCNQEYECSVAGTSQVSNFWLTIRQTFFGT